MRYSFTQCSLPDIIHQNTILPSKVKRRYLLTSRVSRYFLLHLFRSILVQRIYRKSGYFAHGFVPQPESYDNDVYLLYINVGITLVYLTHTYRVCSLGLSGYTCFWSSCYTDFIHYSTDWSGHDGNCRSLGAHVYSIETQEEQTYINNYMNKYYCKILCQLINKEVIDYLQIDQMLLHRTVLQYLSK